MYLIVGLGNPSSQYENTRHNAGFIAVDKLANPNATWKSEHNALTQKIKIGSEEVLIAKPQTFMNRSGDAVLPLLSWYKIPLNRLIVLVDDVQLDCGRIRVRGKGSHGGQNGLRDIIEKVGDSFSRVRFGCSRSLAFSFQSCHSSSLGKATLKEQLLSATRQAAMTT